MDRRILEAFPVLWKKKVYITVSAFGING